MKKDKGNLANQPTVKGKLQNTSQRNYKNSSVKEGGMDQPII